ncbi:MAG: organomercurial lyase, partial [Acidimicrobiia bacterium]
MMTDTKLRDWAEQLAAASPTMDPEQQRIALQVYRLIAETAEPVTITQIADGAGLSAARVEESLRAWPLVLRDDKDRVVGFWGIHAEHITPTHAIEVDGTTVYAWCAWDTLFITEILGRQT